MDKENCREKCPLLSVIIHQHHQKFTNSMDKHNRHNQHTHTHTHTNNNNKNKNKPNVCAFIGKNGIEKVKNMFVGERTEGKRKRKATKKNANKQ